MYDGILIIDKPKDYTSRDIVNIVSKKFNTKKVGHTGTLDPLATGVLVICVGKATKLVEYLTSTYKEYEAELILGIKTDTADITGKVLKEEDSIKNKDEIKKVLNNMIGKYMQTVPIYSAVKINGKKLYEYAREGIDIELPKREVEIKKLELLDIKYEDNKTIVKIKTLVSKGTYIRSLIEDIATNLNTIGTMSNLRRTKQGKFNIEDSCTIDNIDNVKILSIEDILNDIYSVDVDDNLYNKIKNGAIIDNIYNKDLILFKKDGKILSAYKKYEKKEDKLKPYIMFL